MSRGGRSRPPLFISELHWFGSRAIDVMGTSASKRRNPETRIRKMRFEMTSDDHILSMTNDSK